MTDLQTGAGAPDHLADSWIEAALSCLRAGGPDDVAAATAQLKAAADQGSAEGWRWLAALSAAGVGMPQDWERALDLLVTAAQGGSASAQGQLRALAADASGAADGDRSDWPALRRSVRVHAWFQRGEKTVLSAAPRIVTVRGFIPAGACAWLRGRTGDGLSQALLLTGEAATDEGGYRTHSAYAFNFVDCDVVLLMARARIAANIGVPLGSLEVSQILHYRIGESFGLHWDFLKPDVPKEANEIAAKGQRIVTFLIYLNGGFEGGETDFPRLGVRFRGEPGDALYFANVDGAGEPDPRTLHAGLPPFEGEKWLFSQGVRSLAWV
jgi:prolyl 4-hydroxylase